MSKLFKSTYEKALSSGNSYITEFVEHKATKAQLEHIEIATGILSFCSMGLVMEYTDDVHLDYITKALIALDDADFIAKLNEVETFEDYKSIAIPDNEMLKWYMLDGQQNEGKGFLFAD